MKSMKLNATLIIGAALLSSGCASSLPSSEDRETWEIQQNQAAAKKETAMEQDPLAMSLYWAYWLSMIGYAASGGK